MQHREILAHLDRAIEFPDATRRALLELAQALTASLEAVQEAAWREDQVFLSTGTWSRLAEVRERYSELRQHVMHLAAADGVDGEALARLRASLVQTQRDEMRLLFDAFWTDVGGGD